MAGNEPSRDGGGLKYLIYTETFPSRTPGAVRQTGIGRYCADLAAGLASLGHDVVVLTNDSIGAGASDEPYVVRSLGSTPRTRGDLARRAATVIREIRRAAPDYVLVGDPLAHQVIGKRALGAFPARVCPILYGTELVRWRTLCRSRSPMAFLRRRWLRRYLEDAYARICISRFTRGLLHEVVAEKRDECIVYPCVSELFLRQPVEPLSARSYEGPVRHDGRQPLTLLTVARISERKNQLGVLEALARLRARNGPPWHYVIVGNVDAESHRAYLARLEAFVAAQQMTDAVTIVGNTTDQEKIGYIDACDAAIMLSRSAGGSVEGFGISVIEAAVRGKPVIVSSEGGMPETVVEGETGFVVPPDEPARVAEVLAFLGGDPVRRAAMGAAGRRFTLENFIPPATAQRLHAQLSARDPSAGRSRTSHLPSALIQ